MPSNSCPTDCTCTQQEAVSPARYMMQSSVLRRSVWLYSLDLWKALQSTALVSDCLQLYLHESGTRSATLVLIPYKCDLAAE